MIKKFLSIIPVIAILMIVPSMAVTAVEYTPIIAGDTVKAEWKFSFGNGEAENGYTKVNKSAHPVMGDLETGNETGYGFVGTWKDDFNFNERYDGLTMVKGHITNLKETENGIGSIGAESGTNGFEYPLRFGFNTKTGTYFRVRAVLTNLEDGKDATDVTLWTERKHPVVSHDTIEAGKSITLEFSVDVEPNYFEKSSPKGLFNDDMLNIVIAGENVALKSMEIQEVQPGTTLWVLGDSTVTDGRSSLPYFELNNYTGVGSGLSKFIRKDIAVSNQGEGGLSALDNNHFNVVKERIKQGDYMYVEYGHNHKTDGAVGYLNSMDKYYQACKSAGATLVLVGPIDRHNSYDSQTNTWLTSLSVYSCAAKGYVDTMMYGGEEKAKTFVSIYATNGETAALEYRDKTVTEANGNIAVNNVAFVDLNQPSLNWFATISKSGIIAGEEKSNDAALINYYFQTAKGAKTDATHPNDAGAEALAELFFKNANAKIKEYPVLTRLLQTYENMTPKDDETPSGRLWKPLADSPLNSRVYVGYAGGAGWPDAVSIYSEPLKIRKVNFDVDGNLSTMEVQVQDNNIMPTYGRGIVAIYDANGRLTKMAFSNAEEESVNKGLTGWVDNSTGIGIQTLAFDGTDLKENDGETIKAFVWGMEDKEGYPLNMKPYTSGNYEPVTFDYLIENDSQSGAENFHFYGLKANSSFTNKNNWNISGLNAETKSENNDETWYGKFSGKGSMSHDLSETQITGIVEISGKIRNAKNTAFKLSDGNNSLTGISVSDDGKVFDGNNTELGTIKGEWTDFTYTLDIDKGMAYASFEGIKGSEYQITSYDTMLADKLKPYPISKVIIDGTNADFELTDFTVKSVVRQEELANCIVTGGYTSDCNVEMGSIEISDSSVPQGGKVTLTAKAAPEYKFIGWYSANSGIDSELISVKQSVELRVPHDITVYAKFEYSEGIYFIEDFEGYDTGVKISQNGNDKETAPDPVEIGSLILNAGYRNNGPTDGKSTISIEESKDKTNKYMVCSAGNTASSGRGVKFLFANEFNVSHDTFILEFDAKLSGSGMKLLGKERNQKEELVDAVIAEYTAEKNQGLETGEWVNIKIIFNAAAKEKYLVITDEQGKILNLEKSAYKAETIIGASFYDAGQGTVAFDNMMFYKLGAPNTKGQMPQDATITAPAGTTVRIGSNLISAITDAQGKAVIKLVQGKYDIVATNDSYKTYEGSITIDDAYTATLDMETGENATVTINYTDTNGNVIKSETLTNGLFKGEPFTLDNTYIAEFAGEKDTDGTFCVYKYNAEHSDNLEINSLDDTNIINIVVDKVEGFLYYENCNSTAVDELKANGWASDSISLVQMEGYGNSVYLADNSSKNAGKSLTMTLPQIDIQSKYTYEMDAIFVGGNSALSTFEITSADGYLLKMEMTKPATSKTTTLEWKVNDSETDIITLEQSGVTSAPWVHISLVVEPASKTVTAIMTQRDKEIMNKTFTIENSPIITGFKNTQGKSYPKSWFDNVQVYISE